VASGRAYWNDEARMTIDEGMSKLPHSVLAAACGIKRVPPSRA
jgi:hypothetical protein